jgi:hypothetical protein
MDNFIVDDMNDDSFNPSEVATNSEPVFSHLSRFGRKFKLSINNQREDDQAGSSDGDLLSDTELFCDGGPRSEDEEDTGSLDDFFDDENYSDDQHKLVLENNM